MKINRQMVKMMLMSILTAGTTTIVFTACSDELDLKDTTSSFSPDMENAPSAISEEQTYDAMNVRVTTNVDGAVMSRFGNNSVGAALARRLPSTSNQIDKETRLILVNGNDIARYRGSDMKSWAKVYLKGGSIAVERPTGAQLNALADALSEQLAAARTALLTADGDIVVKPHANQRS